MRIFIIIIVGSLLLLVGSTAVWAAPLSNISDQMDRINEATASGHLIQFISSGVGAGQSITVTFPSGIFSFGASYNFNDMVLSEGNSADCSTASFSTKTLAAVAAGPIWGATYAADVVTFTSGTDTIAGNRCIRIRLNSNGAGHTLANPGVGANTSYVIGLAVAGTDFGNAAVVVLNDAGTPDGDQVRIDTIVLSTLNFDLDVVTNNCVNNNETAAANNVITFGSLVPGILKTSGSTFPFICLDFGSNSLSGINVYVQSSRAATAGGLQHSNAVDAIVSATADLNSAAVLAGYGLRVSSVGAPTIGSIIINSPFNSDTTASVGQLPGTSTSAVLIVHSTNVVQTGTGNRVAVEVSAKAENATPTGSYADTITFTATATF